MVKEKEGKKEMSEEEQGKRKTPRLGNALRDKLELVSWDLRKKNFKGTATEAKTTATVTSHTRTVFQRSSTGKRRRCFLHWPLLPQQLVTGQGP